MVNNEPAPRLMILPATEPSMMTFAPGSIVKLPRRCPRTCKRQFFCTIVSLTTELFISDEPVTRRRPASTSCVDSIATFDKSAGPTDQVLRMIASFQLCRKIRTLKT